MPFNSPSLLFNGPPNKEMLSLIGGSTAPLIREIGTTNYEAPNNKVRPIIIIREGALALKLGNYNGFRPLTEPHLVIRHSTPLIQPKFSVNFFIKNIN